MVGLCLSFLFYVYSVVRITSYLFKMAVVGFSAGEFNTRKDENTFPFYKADNG